MKNLKEIAGLRWQVVILFAAVIIGIGYMAFFVFKFYRSATDFVNRHRDDDGDEPEEPEEPQPEEPQTATNETAAQNGQAHRQPEHVSG